MNLNKAYYTKQEIENIERQINSLDNFDVEKKYKLVSKLKRYQNKYINQLEYINDVIEQIEDDETRLIARYRFIDNLKWQEIADKLFKDRTACYRKLQRYLTQITHKKWFIIKAYNIVRFLIWRWYLLAIG